jgi:hypothetical protein
VANLSLRGAVHQEQSRANSSESQEEKSEAGKTSTDVVQLTSAFRCIIQADFTREVRGIRGIGDNGRSQNHFEMNCFADDVIETREAYQETSANLNNLCSVQASAEGFTVRKR